MQRIFPATYSVLAADTWLPEYALGEALDFIFHHRGLTDTDIVRTSADRYVLRVYPTGWRSDDAVAYELAVLRHLQEQGIPVAALITRRDGASIRTLPAPEGPRQVVLFAYAPGREDAGGEDHRLR